MNKKKVLVTLCNEGYIDQAKALFASAYFNGGWDGDFLLLAHDVPSEKLLWFERKGVVVWRCESMTPEVYDRWSGVFLSKLYVFSPEIRQWDHVIYLDADCVVRGSLDNLVMANGIAALQYNPLPDEEVASRPSKMFNSGVITFSTDLITDQTFTDIQQRSREVRKNISSPEGLILMDELIFSEYFQDQCKDLKLPYHVMPESIIRNTGISPAKLKGIIIHHAKSDMYPKPWDETSPFHKEWKQNFDQADLIDMKNPQPSQQAWSGLKIRQYLFMFYLRSFVHWPFWKIDRLIGVIGKILKKYTPTIYFLLKNYFLRK